jgi:hypothetical protein
MSESKASNVVGGIGFTGMLTIAFIVLKLTHVIEWPWFWVLSPSIFGVAIFIIIVVVALVIAIKA